MKKEEIIALVTEFLEVANEGQLNVNLSVGIKTTKLDDFVAKEPDGIYLLTITKNTNV